MRLIYVMILRERTRPTPEEANHIVNFIMGQLKVRIGSSRITQFLANNTSESESFEDFCKRVIELKWPAHFKLDQYFMTLEQYGRSGKPSENTFIRLVFEKDDTDFAQVYQISPEVQALIDKGQSLEAQADWIEAWNTYQTGLEEFSNDPYLILRLTRMLFHPAAGRLRGALVQILQKVKKEYSERALDACSRYPTDANIAVALGDIYYYGSQGSIANAVEFDDGSVFRSFQDERTTQRLRELAYLQYARANRLLPTDASIRNRYVELCAAVGRTTDDDFFHQ